MADIVIQILPPVDGRGPGEFTTHERPSNQDVYQSLENEYGKGTLKKGARTLLAKEGILLAAGAYTYTLTSAPQGLLTLRQVAEDPPPRLQDRLSPPKSCSKTKPTAPRTFSDIEAWPEFMKGSEELYNSLDDREHRYNPPGRRIDPDAENSLPAAADEAEVRGCVISLLRSANDVAVLRCIEVEYAGGGSGRSTSFTDLLMRRVGVHSHPASLSSTVLGNGEVKGVWQFQLEQGERLEDALRDPQRIEGVLHAIQQAYGDAVLDEAPIFFLTNYHVTVFLKRSADVMDKRIWASEPIWYDRIYPPARACWVHGLQLAQQMQPLKRSLPRVVVPPTVEGYIIQQRPQQQVQHLEAQEAEAGSISARRVRRRVTPSVCVRLQARCASGKGYEIASESLSAATEQTVGVADPAAALAAEDTLTLLELGLSDELLGAGQFGYTLRGEYGGQQAAVKLYNLRRQGAAAAYETEKLCYNQLEALQGHAVPRLLCSGLLQHTGAPVIVTSMEGEAVEEGRPVPRKLQRPMRQVLQALHAAGAAHGDVRCCNFLVKDGHVRLVDLGQTVLKATADQMEADMQRLKAMFP